MNFVCKANMSQIETHGNMPCLLVVPAVSEDEGVSESASASLSGAESEDEDEDLEGESSQEVGLG